MYVCARRVEKDDRSTLQDRLKELRAEELRRIENHVAVEQAWWSNHIIENEQQAISNGLLYEVADQGNGYYLTGQLRRRDHPNTLSANAIRLLEEIGEWWSRYIGVSKTERLFLSVSSLYRSPELQRQLVANSYLATRGVSSHCSGNAIDFDPNGYYKALGSLKNPVNSRSQDFNSKAAYFLRVVLYFLQSQGKCNVIMEKKFYLHEGAIISYHACYHVCVSPHAYS